MRRKWASADTMTSRTVLLIALIAIGAGEGARRTAQRRRDSSQLVDAAPSAETLQALAQAVGAAGFEHYTEGRPLVKRLIPGSQADLDVVEHQGVIGRAGVDFPAFPNIPNTGFNCKNVPTGYYADLETDCQVFHICDTSRKISFLCPNGTIFSQSHLICDWWFKVDCASAPALYESSAEYYSNEQKKSQKISSTNSKSQNPDLQEIGSDTSVRAEPRKINDVPTTTERFLRHRQRLQNDGLPIPKATSRSFQSLYTESVFPTQRTQATPAFEKRRKNLVQLIANNFGNPQARTTVPPHADVPAFKTTPVAREFNNYREMQVAAESASFANNNNRQYLQDLNNKNLRPYPVYTPNLPKSSNSKSSLTTLYDIGVNHFNQEKQEVTTKRSTLVPYTKSYASASKEPYTRPGISLLRNFIEKEKNKTLSTSTEKMATVTERSDIYEVNNNANSQVTIENKSSYESATKIPQLTRAQQTFTSSDKHEFFSTTNSEQVTTEPNYQERRERLMRKLKFDAFKPTEATNPSGNEKYYGDQPNRPGLIVPPSLTPKTLHTLAIYYATALDNLSTTPPPEDTEVTTHSIDEYEGLEDGLPGLFSAHTINKYTHLFGQMTDNPEALGEIKMDPNVTYNEIVDDLTVQQSQNPFATSPQIRELAQVFTHALSAYLQDPVQFRKVLSDIRPTQPSFGDMFTTEGYTNTEPTTTVNEDDEEILGFSDDNKVRSPLVALREPKQLNFATDYPTTAQDVTATEAPREVTEFITTTRQLTTTRRPYICCGRISASYTSASTSKPSTTTPLTFTNAFAAKVNALGNNTAENFIATTEDSYINNRFGGFQNNSINDSPYGKDLAPSGKPLSNYVIATDLPTAWGVDTTAPVTTDVPSFESKKIRTTSEVPTTSPIYFTETESIELENEEELQRAQSHSFVGPQSNSIRHGKQIGHEETKTTAKKPSEDLEAPTVPEADLTTARPTHPITTVHDEAFESISTVSSTQTNVYTTPETYKTTSDFQWPSTLQNWHSTIVDPITLNDNLTPENLRKFESQFNNWLPSTTPAPTTYTTSEPVYSTTFNVEVSTPSRNEDRFGRLLRDQTATEPAQDITTIADSVVEKAKEIMGGMNATTTQKLMNVMKKTKSKTVKRLILLLVQTCDDDHNSTAEASKRALLEALMAVSQKDMEEVAKEESATEFPTTYADIDAVQTTNFVRRMDQALDKQELQAKATADRRGKSLNFEASAINSLSNPSTTERVSTTTTELVTEVPSTTPITSRSTITSRRGSKKFFSRTPVELHTTKETFVDVPVAAARVAAPEEVVKTDTRALELLKSLYTIASRWG